MRVCYAMPSFRNLFFLSLFCIIKNLFIKYCWHGVQCQGLKMTQVNIAHNLRFISIDSVDVNECEGTVTRNNRLKIQAKTLQNWELLIYIKGKSLMTQYQHLENGIIFVA
jgi:hypothetical protein